MKGVWVWLFLAQSPYPYLGIDQVGRYFHYQGGIIESVYVMGNWMVYEGTRIDTFKANQTLIYNGYFGYEWLWKGKITLNGQSQTYTNKDTTWEVGNDIRFLWTADTVTRELLYYHTPFNIGVTWKMGLPDSIKGDFDGDGLEDKIAYLRDTVRVISRDSITVPLGNFYAYKILRELQSEGEFTGNGMPYTSNTFQKVYEWISPYDGMVKDSMFTIIVINSAGITTIMKMHDKRECGEKGVNVSERISFPSQDLHFFYWDRIYKCKSPNGILWVKVYDPAGRKLYEKWYNGRYSVTDKLNFASGVYIIVIKDKKMLKRLKIFISE